MQSGLTMRDSMLPIDAAQGGGVHKRQRRKYNAQACVICFADVSAAISARRKEKYDEKNNNSHRHSSGLKDIHVMSEVELLLYGRKTAAKRLDVSLRTVDYALSRGEFETKKIGSRRMITNRSLKSWASKNHYGSTKKPKQATKDDDQDKAA
jgi:hypothetical protein